MLNLAFMNFCFSQATILTAATCIPHSVSSDFAVAEGLFSVIASCYPELSRKCKRCLNIFLPGSLLTYFDWHKYRLIYNLVEKRRIFHESSYATLELSLQPLKQPLEGHNIRGIAPAKHGCGFDQSRCPTVFSIKFKIFPGVSNNYHS